jgi:hypothetical protein
VYFKKKVLLELVKINDNYKFLYERSTDTHIFITRVGRFYSLVVRSSSLSYSNGTGVLSSGCPQAATRTRRQAAAYPNNLNCSTCSELFISTVNHDNEINPHLLNRICRFDCAQTGNASQFALLLSQTNAALGFARMGDQIKNVTLLLEEILKRMSTTTAAASTTSSIATSTNAVSTFEASSATINTATINTFLSSSATKKHLNKHFFHVHSNLFITSSFWIALTYLHKTI